MHQVSVCATGLDSFLAAAVAPLSQGWSWSEGLHMAVLDNARCIDSSTDAIDHIRAAFETAAYRVAREPRVTCHWRMHEHTRLSSAR